MRFVLGLLMGVMAVVWISGLVGDPRALLAELRAGLVEAVATVDVTLDAVVDSARDTPRGPTRDSTRDSTGDAPGDAPEDAPRGALPEADTAPEGEPAPRADEPDALRAAVAAGLEREPAPQPLPAPAPALDPGPGPDTRRLAEGPPSPVPEAGGGVRVDASGSADLAAVWVPFHSERSASGFAGRLSRALDHPFRVRRQGPGAYEVVFPYQDSSQRDALLAEVSTLTGAQP